MPRHHSATDTANAYRAPRLGQQSASYRMTRLAKKALYYFALMCWLVVIASGFYLVWTYSNLDAPSATDRRAIGR